MKNYQNKAWLKGKYLDEKLSTLKIADLCGLRTHVTILDWLNRFKIKRRTLSEAKAIFHPRGMLGKHHSEETKKKIGRAFRGKKIGPFSDEHRRNISRAMKGKLIGDKNPHWNGGASFEPWGQEFTRELRKTIRECDKFKCQKCGRKERSRKHCVHHVDFNPRNNRPENLILLCRPCHVEVHRGEEDGRVEIKR